MSVRPIIVAPDPRLKTECAPVAVVDDGVRALLGDMLESMYEADGIGLAAPQIGVHKRVIVMDIAPRDEPRAPMTLINPEIVWASDETTTREEGCLSLPDQYGDVTRPARVRVRYLDETGEARELEASGLLAVCVQHEMDHLSGTLFVDHLSALKRGMILRRLQKLKKQKAGIAA